MQSRLTQIANAYIVDTLYIMYQIEMYREDKTIRAGKSLPELFLLFKMSNNDSN